MSKHFNPESVPAIRVGAPKRGLMIGDTAQHSLFQRRNQRRARRENRAL